MKPTELIKPEDVRLGNYILDDKEIVKVSKSLMTYILEENHPFYSIELTEELLLRVGAEDQDGYFQHDRFELRYRKEYKFWYVLDLESATYLTKVEYLHEYQNFYKAMNGKELTLI